MVLLAILNTGQCVSNFVGGFYALGLCESVLLNKVKKYVFIASVFLRRSSELTWTDAT
jgi:hypothetical protein